MKSNMRVTNTMSKTVRTLAVVLAVFCAVIALGFVAVPQAQAQGFPMFSWGDNTHGRLGRPVTIEYPANLPGRVSDRADWVYSATAAGGAFALSRQGHLYGWGSHWTSPHMGQGGVGSGTIGVPTRIETASNWVSVAARSNVVAAINSRGELFTWGTNAQGQLGHGDTYARYTPTQVGTRTDWKQVAVGGNNGDFLLAITTSGHLYAWGNQTNIISNQRTPIRIGNADNWTSVSAGGLFAAAINSDGELFTWGGNVLNFSALGRTSNATFPQNQPGPVDLTHTSTANDWIDVRTTNAAVAAINASGYIYTWGAIDFGQLGRPTNIVPANRAGRVGTDSNWISVMGGNSHFLAFNSDRELWAWGNNSAGQLGIGQLGGQSGAPAYVTTVQRFSSAARGGGTLSIMLLQTDPVILDLTKHLRKPEGTPNPEAEFTFNVVRHAFNGNENLYDRLPEINPIVLRPSEIVNPNEPNPAPAGIITREGSMNIFCGIEFTEAGRFTYRVNEVLGSSEINTPPLTNFDYPITYSRAVYEISVYVIEDPDNAGELIIDEITVYRIRDAGGGTDNLPVKVDNLIFTNTYRPITTDALEVSKYIEGSFAVLSATFQFTVTLTATALCPAGTTFAGRIYDGDDVYVETITFASGTPVPNVTLGHDWRLVFPGPMAVGTSFVVVEAACPNHIASVDLTVDGVPINIPPNTVVNQELSTGLRLIGVGTNSAEFFNYRPFAEPTGLVIGNGSPYIIFIAAALMVTAVLALKNRKRIEDMPLANLQQDTQMLKTANNSCEGEV